MNYYLFCKMAKAIKLSKEGTKFCLEGYKLDYIDEGSKETINGERLRPDGRSTDNISISYYEGKEIENKNFLC